jgi:6,7-dimethyl-8-ribityllumazine synthase
MASIPLKGPGAPQKHDGSSLRVAIVHARWNEAIIAALVSGCQTALLASGVRKENIVLVSVPGSYELPFAVQRVCAASQIHSTASTVMSSVNSALSEPPSSTGSVAPIGPQAGEGPEAASRSGAGAGKVAPAQGFDAVVAIGVLIKGETMHFEYISEAVSQGLMRVQLDTGVPVIFGLLTLLSQEQGLARAGLAGGTGKEAKGHNHGEDWGNAAVEMAVKRKAWAQGNILNETSVS